MRDVCNYCVACHVGQLLNVCKLLCRQEIVCFMVGWCLRCRAVQSDLLRLSTWVLISLLPGIMTHMLLCMLMGIALTAFCCCITAVC
jgi:hypothetical protein